ncbi:hypothetical protein Agub_g3787 [Astrephomene gubernaculifera]|uniref:Protein kinase domain-containing protein n=1 Tax=Astrephomene gubernaculifera TaxID=47775 RepID=A0AAD3HJP1_9CHLO|nr:hypothetical protein Agub_g3787 [Astrephomene gubernaculifera]
MASARREGYFGMDWRVLEILRVLDEGTYGIVLAVRHRLTGELFAVKAGKNVTANGKVPYHTIQELKVLRRLPPHPNIVRLADVFWAEEGRMYLAFEFAYGGLHKELERFPGHILPPAVLRTVARQLLQAVAHCHDHKIIHRDIKPANVLLSRPLPTAAPTTTTVVGSGTTVACTATPVGMVTATATTSLAPLSSISSSSPSSSPALPSPSPSAPPPSATAPSLGNCSSAPLQPPQVVVKLCDFGFARAVQSSDPKYGERHSPYVVTRYYRAPEVLVGGSYGASVDIWSYGCTLAELAIGRPLFPGRSSLDQLHRIMSCLGPLPPQQLEALRCDLQLVPLEQYQLHLEQQQRQQEERGQQQQKQQWWRLLQQQGRKGERQQQHQQRRQQQSVSIQGASLPPGLPVRCERLESSLAGMDSELFQVISACLTLDPGQRPTAQQLLQMPYFQPAPTTMPASTMATAARPNEICVALGCDSSSSASLGSNDSPVGRHVRTTATGTGIRTCRMPRARSARTYGYYEEQAGTVAGNKNSNGATNGNGLGNGSRSNAGINNGCAAVRRETWAVTIPAASTASTTTNAFGSKPTVTTPTTTYTTTAGTNGTPAAATVSAARSGGGDGAVAASDADAAEAAVSVDTAAATAIGMPGEQPATSSVGVRSVDAAVDGFAGAASASAHLSLQQQQQQQQQPQLRPEVQVQLQTPSKPRALGPLLLAASASLSTSSSAVFSAATATTASAVAPLYATASTVAARTSCSSAVQLMRSAAASAMWAFPSNDNIVGGYDDGCSNCDASAREGTENGTGGCSDPIVDGTTGIGSTAVPLTAARKRNPLSLLYGWGGSSSNGYNAGSGDRGCGESGDVSAWSSSRPPLASNTTAASNAVDCHAALQPSSVAAAATAAAIATVPVASTAVKAAATGNDLVRAPRSTNSSSSSAETAASGVTLSVSGGRGLQRPSKASAAASSGWHLKLMRSLRRNRSVLSKGVTKLLTSCSNPWPVQPTQPSSKLSPS